MPKRSWVWDHYSNPENGVMVCSTCNKKLKYDKCTTNLIKLAKIHNISKKTDSNDNTILENGCPYEGILHYSNSNE